jgi:hypothetical protein
MLVKITELNNIGSNISYQTLIPVVDTAGNATTEKANLQIVGNLILNGAGGVNFPRAAQANIALSVANAAQPNITSVGTLTNLNVTGTVTANLFVGNLLGNLTNAVFAINAGNVTNNAQPNITSVGTLVDLEIAGNLNGYSIGNIIEVNLDGNSSNVLHGDGSWSADITDYGNSNVANYLPTFTGNIGNLSFQYANTLGTILGKDGSFLKLFGPDDTILGCDTGNTAVWSNGKVEIRSGIDGLNDKITSFYANGDVEFFDGAILSSGGLYGNSTAVLGNKSGQVQVYAQNAGVGIQTYTGSAYNTWTFDNAGNLVLPGNTFAVKYANGTTVSLGGGSSISNGTSNVNISTVNGPVFINAGAFANWKFDTDSALRFSDGNTFIQPGSAGTLNIISDATGGSGAIQFFTDYNNAARSWSFDAYGLTGLPVTQGFTETSIISTNGGNRIGFSVGGNSLVFNNDATITFPITTVDLHNGGNQYAYTLQFGNSDYQSVITGPTPAVDTNAQRLIIQGQRGNGTGEGGDVYFWAGDADTNGGDIKIYAGDADNVSTGYGGYVNIDGGSGYDVGGAIELTGGYSQGGNGGPVNVTAGQGANGGAVSIIGGGGGTTQGGNVGITGGYGAANGGEVRLTGGSAGTGIPGYGNIVVVSGASTWTFDNGGNLVLPNGNSVIYSTANSSLDPLIPNVSTMTLTPDANYNSQVLVLDPTAPGHIHLRAYAFSNIDEPAANIFLGGENTAFEITSGANNDARIHSGSNTWYFENNGNLVTPGLTGTYIKSAPGGYMGLAAMNDGGDQPAQLVSFDSNLGLGTTAISAYANNAIIQANINGDIKSWNFDNTGNLTLPGNTFAINYANGTQVALGGLPLANGNSNFDISSANGNATITVSGTNVFNFDIFGNLSLPGNILSNNTIFIDTRDNSNVADIDLYSGDDILLQGGIRTTTNQPEGGDINIFAGSGGPGSGGESSGGGDITLLAGKGGDAGDTDLGNFGGSISLQAGHGGNADVGNLQVAGGGGSLTIEAGDAGTNGGNTSLGRQGGSLNLYAGNTTEEAQNGAAVTIQSGYGGANALAGNLEINIPASDLGSGGTWYFNGYGNLEAPGNITASSNISGSTLFSTLASGNEGGELQLAKPPNGTLSGGITVDAYINQLRFFEQGGTTRGLYIDIANSPAGVSAAIGYRDIPQVVASNTTIAATDAGKHYYSTTAGNLTLTIPNNATTSFQTGTAISIVVQAAGNVLVNAASGVTLYMAGSSSAGNRAVGSYGMATLMKVATDTWFINGTGVY